MTDGIEIKICGLTRPDQAAACVAAGAQAIGVVFHRASPRNLDPAGARAIVAALPAGFPVVGVFAHTDVETILTAVGAAGLRIVQLHTPKLQETQTACYERLAARGLRVVQSLAFSGGVLREAAATLPARVGVLVECGRGPLPGGNGLRWDWSGAASLRGVCPFALAGGLDPGNVAAALAASGATAVDVSSGVESAPGVKDLARVRAFIAAVRAAPGTATRWKVFGEATGS